DNQDDCVDRAQFPIEMRAGIGEIRLILRAVENISKEHPAEEHDFSNEESPHPKRARLFLLFHVIEVMGQPVMTCSMTIGQLLYPPRMTNSTALLWVWGCR